MYMGYGYPTRMRDSMNIICIPIHGCTTIPNCGDIIQLMSMAHTAA